MAVVILNSGGTSPITLTCQRAAKGPPIEVGSVTPSFAGYDRNGVRAFKRTYNVTTSYIDSATEQSIQDLIADEAQIPCSGDLFLYRTPTCSIQCTASDMVAGLSPVQWVMQLSIRESFPVTGSVFDYDQPLPAFIEGWASNSFHGQNYNVPTGWASIATDSEGEHILMMTVSGASGAATVTGAGFDTVNGTGSWSCVIKHDDGTYGIYTASGITATTLAISPNLRATTTAQPCHSLGGTANGQHYGQNGYKALARMIFAQNKRSGYRGRFINKFRATDTSGWTATGGLSAGNPAYNNNRNQWPSSAGTGSFFFARGTKTLVFDTAIAGRGVTRTAYLGGQSGYLEAFVGIDDAFGASAFHVVVVVDGVTLLDTTYTAFQRIVVPFANASSGTMTITNNASVQTEYRIGDVTWWCYDRTGVTWTDPVIGKNEKVVVLGNSWSTRYSAVLGTELAAAQTAAGGTTGSVTSVGLAGQTAEWGLANFDTLVKPLAPNVVVIEFFVNDYNAYPSDPNRWLAALYAIGEKCQAIGARPVFLMPLPTQSSAQLQNLGIWSELIGIGAAL